MRHSLHRGFREAKPFYLSYTAMVILAAGIVLIPGAPLGLITTSVQALAGLLLPSASVFLLLLCNDRQVLGPWVNARWLNLLAGFIVSVLLLLSGILMATTLFPHVDATHVGEFLEVHYPGPACLPARSGDEQAGQARLADAATVHMLSCLGPNLPGDGGRRPGCDR